MKQSITPPRVIAIVLNWNNLSDTLECIESLRCSDYPCLAIWVVDNNSDHDPTSELQSKYSDIRVLRNKRNLGYGGGNNTGILAAMEAGAVYILLLNNDVVLAPDCVARLVSSAEANPEIGMATPTVFHYHRPNDVYWNGGVVDWRTGDVHHDPSGLTRAGGILQSEWLNGCSLLVRVSTICDIGLLDQRYFLYFEDAAWSVLAARHGWTNAVVCEARAWHKVSASTGGFDNPLMRYYFFRNRYLFSTTLSPLPRCLRWKLTYLAAIWSAYVRERHEPENRRVFLSVLIDLVSGSTGAYEGSFTTRTLVLRLDGMFLCLFRVAGSFKKLLRRVKRMRHPSDG
ncbi:MAG TPA: glycosyltransferase family 2 protein [Methylomirabilota bacterium]|nr:glycosyltransferase family 2 protein [Methylomirabilota bacterium]